jgi:FtsH-binding integral membrane protein
VWDLTDLEYINKKRVSEGLPKIEIVKKHFDVDLGIRAHTEMSFGKSLKSIFIPHHNEFIFIWLYLGFAVYFWVITGLLIAQDEKTFEFKSQDSYNYMLIAALVVAVSVTITLFYLVFYSINSQVERTLKKIDTNFKYFAVFVLLIVFLIAEESANPVRLNENLTLLDLLIYLTISIYVVLAVLIQYDSAQTAAFLIALLYVFVVLLVDFIYSDHKQAMLFYLPLLIMVIIITIALIFVFFHIPERWCVETRIHQLYF